MKARSVAVLLSSLFITAPLFAQDPPKNVKPVVNTSRLPKIDLNKADVSTLAGSFKGIGKRKAEAIVAYRESHRGFKSIEELGEIKGFGRRFMENNRSKLKEIYVVSAQKSDV